MAALIHSLINCIIANSPDELWQYLNLGVDPNGFEDQAKVRPLHFAVLYNSVECAKILLAMGANPKAKDSNGQSALDLAKELNEGKEMLKLLQLGCSKISTVVN